MKLKKAPLISLTLFVVSNMWQVAQAYWCPKYYYISGVGGLAWMREMDLKLTNTASDKSLNIITDYDVGYGVGGAVGAGITNNWRFEVEGYFRNNEGDEMKFKYASETELRYPHFHYRSFSLMANTFYDFSLCECISLYIGGGVGAAWVKFLKEGPPFIYPLCDSQCPDCDEMIGAVCLYGCTSSCCAVSTPDNGICRCPCSSGVNAGVISSGPSPVYDLDDIRFAYQVMIGLAYTVICNLDFTLGYRLWGTLEEKNHPNNGLKLSEERIPIMQSLEFGLRLRF